jgi:hypothetical protein
LPARRRFSPAAACRPAAALYRFAVRRPCRAHHRAAIDSRQHRGGADEALKHLDLAFEQTGNDVRATAKYDKSRGFFAGAWPPVKVDFIVAVPADFASELRISGGAIEVGNLQGKVDARTSGGSIKLVRLGGAVDARTSGGGITLTEARGPVKLETSGGNITVRAS